jgi:hypothetical protein
MSAELKLELAPGAPEIVFDPGQNGCSPNDIPDAAARAFRDASGMIHLVATAFENRQFVGTSFDALKHPCEQIFMSRENPDPAAYADRSWLTAFFTGDGRIVHALIHHEYQGDTHPSPLCVSRQYLRCWENSILTTVSTDGGYHFADPVIPRDLVAAPPTRYIGEVANKPIGYFQPSNIVSRGGEYFVLIKAENFANQRRGNCLLRTDDLSAPRGWKASDGDNFSVTFADPYREPLGDPSLVCAPVGTEQEFGPTVMSLVHDTVSGLYIAVIETGRSGGATHYSTSQDLMSWTTPSLLWAAPVPWMHICQVETTVFTPSLIDHMANDRNFATVSTSPQLYLYYAEDEFTGCGARRSRKLFRRQVKILR